MLKTNNMMEFLDSVYNFYSTYDYDRNITVRILVDHYGCTKTSVDDVLDTAIIKANKDAKGESCAADVEALIARHTKKANDE